MANWVIRGASIKNLEGDIFEQFCFELLAFEVAYRHSGAGIDGPPPKYVSDKGEDLGITITMPPKFTRQSFDYALTEDDLCRTCISCKSGRGWEAAVKKDGLKQSNPKNVLEAGGHFSVFVNQQVGYDKTLAFTHAIANILAKRLRSVPESLVSRIHLIDADDLALFLAHHPIRLDPVSRQLLGMPNLDGLEPFAEWQSGLDEDRTLPEFSTDAPRGAALAALGSELSPHPANRRSRVIWVYGPPGVGKTRLVFEAIQRTPSAAERTLASTAFEHGQRAVEAQDVPNLEDVILVIDECPAVEVQRLSGLFRARAGDNGATLILIGPQDTDVETSRLLALRLEVQPLEDGAARKLARHELSIGSLESDDTVGRVLHLTEGYPWFTILLARAVREDPGSLPSGSNQWSAAKLAIAGSKRDYASAQEWEDTIERRAKALIAVLLTEGLDWRRLEPTYQTRLGAALGPPWMMITQEAERCRRRGLVRVRQDWRYKYVTPNNLARLVATHYLRSPHFLAQAIRDQVPELRETFYRRLEILKVPDDLLEELAVEELTRPLADDQPPLSWLFLARWQPAATARRLRSIIEQFTIAQLRHDTTMRRQWIPALEHIVHRRRGFEDAEAALFQLGLAENESWANNATGVWSSLFMGVLHETHLTFGVRLPILRRRLSSDATDARLYALSGLEKATSAERIGPAYSAEDLADGPWYTPSVQELRENKQQSWTLLLALADDVDPLVAQRARQLATANLRDSLWLGIGAFVLNDLADVVATWDESDRAKVRIQLDNIHAYHKKRIEMDVDLADALKRIDIAAGPSTFHDRVVDVVGRWFPERANVPVEKITEHTLALDRRLALEGLENPALLILELSWLESEEAVRAVPFMVEVGVADAKGVLLQPLLDRAKDGTAINTLSAYLLGMSRGLGIPAVDVILQQLQDVPRLAPHVFVTITRLGPSDERIRWIIQAFTQGLIPFRSASYLTLGSWGVDASPAAISNLIEVLAHSNDRTANLAALELIVRRVEGSQGEIGLFDATLTDLIGRLASERLDGMGGYIWKLACDIALSRGHHDLVADAAVRALLQSEAYSLSEVWEVLLDAVKVNPETVWRRFAEAIENSESRAYLLLWNAADHRIVDQVPSELVLSWVGDDVRRSLLIAHLCSPYQASLNEVARQLLIRFGPESPAGRELAARVHSTPDVVTSLSRFVETQLDNARQWILDPNPNVAAWGRDRISELESEYQSRVAEEEFEERHRSN